MLFFGLRGKMLAGVPGSPEEEDEEKPEDKEKEFIDTSGLRFLGLSVGVLSAMGCSLAVLLLSLLLFELDLTGTEAVASDEASATLPDTAPVCSCSSLTCS